MAIIVVEIHVPDTVPRHIDKESDWFTDDGKIVVDSAYLTPFREDDSFFEFKFLGVRDD